MKRSLVLALALVAACSTNTPAISQLEQVETPMAFESNQGETTEAFEGTFTVPENRSDPDSRMLTLHYVRFPATGETAGSPIIYLAGGPGGSGIQTAKYGRYPLFMAMREFGDVIAFDQRGTGASNDTPKCVSSQVISHTEVVSDDDYTRMHAEALRECLDFWAEAEIDVHGYTTLENVADLEALRQHLGADKLTLWGISYGSHLSLAALKEMDDRIDRVVIASAEGLDQTIKQSIRTDEYFARLQAAINTQPDHPEALSDIIALMRRVHTRLEATPLLVQIPQKEGDPAEYLLQRRDMQSLSSAMISDPQRAAQLLSIYAALDQGNVGPLTMLLQRFYGPKDAVSFRLMSVIMDIASGTGAERREMLVKQAETSLLSTFLNQAVELEDVDPSLVLSDQFREKPVSDVPVLLLSGTLDGRTYLESQREAVSGLSNTTLITVRNAGHNLFMSSPDVTATIQAFMRDEIIIERELIVELPDF